MLIRNASAALVLLSIAACAPTPPPPPPPTAGGIPSPFSAAVRTDSGIGATGSAGVSGGPGAPVPGTGSVTKPVY